MCNTTHIYLGGCIEEISKNSNTTHIYLGGVLYCCFLKSHQNPSDFEALCLNLKETISTPRHFIKNPYKIKIRYINLLKSTNQNNPLKFQNIDNIPAHLRALQDQEASY